jgi:integrase
MYEAVRLEQCRPSTRKEYRAQMEQFVFPEFGGAPVDRFTRSDMAKLHVKITTSGRRYRANRVRATVRAFYNWLKAAEVCKCENPAVGIAPNLETNREFYLEPQQFAAVFAALDAYAEKPGGEVAADCVRFLAATGCRSAEARNATWDQFDSKMTIWTKPASATKQKKLHRVPLARAAHEIFVRRFAGRREEQQFVFPDGDGSNPLKEIRSTC